jgi:membrane-bound ClpP family serine protease
MTAALVIGLMVGGLALIAIEIFVIPGFGVIGVLGVAGVVGSAYLAYAQLSPTTAAITIAGGVVCAAAMFWLVPKSKIGKSMVLQTQTIGGAANPELKLLVEREGVALTPLRPSGAVEIDGRPVDVVTDGEYIEPKTRVRVVQVEGARVIVEKIS